MCIKVLFVLAIVVFIAMEVKAASARSKQLSQLFFNNITDPAKLDFTMAKKILSQFKEDDVMVGRVQDSIPVLHHLFNLFRLASNPNDKAGIINIMLSCMNVGADAAEQFNNDPPLIFKAVLMKELHLAREAVRSVPAVTGLLTGEGRWAAAFFSNLYAIPSESVPLVKLLLYADTIVRDKGLAGMGGLEGLKKLLASAVLGKPTVRPVDMERHSAAYAQVVATLGGAEGQLRLLDMIRCLDETAGAVHGALLDAVLQLPDVEQRQIVVTRLVRTLVGMTADGSGPDSSLYPMGRNALHFLCLSGSVVMVDQLVAFLASLKQLEATSAAVVGGDGAPASNVLPQGHVHADSVVLLRDALVSADARGHSPISYAIMRFSRSSPSVAAVRRLCEAVGADMDAAAADALSAGVLRSASQPASASAVTAGDSGEDSGGWHAARLPGLSVGAVDSRVAEVFAATLPTNKDFFRQYLNTGTPAMFRQAVAPSPPAHRTASASTLRHVFQRGAFLDRYGNITVPAATIPYAGTFGVKQLVSTMNAVANSAALPSASKGDAVPLYTFCTPAPQWSAQLLADAPIPRCIARSAGAGSRVPQGVSEEEDCGVGAADPATGSWSFEIQFYLGTAGTGAPAHFHGHAINTLAYGEKHWLLYPPAEAFYSTTPARRLFEQQTGAAAQAANALPQPIKVIQRAGDVLYVPALWGHATFNAAQSIGVAHEFTVESFCME